MDFESKGFDSILEDDLDIQILEVKLQNNAKLDSPMDCEPMTDVKKPPEKNNPVEEHLLKQLNCAVEQIDIAKNNISTIEDVTSSIIKHLTAQCAYKEDPDTDSEDEMYSSTGEPIKKKKKNNQHAKKQVMMPLNVWQRVVGDKWIIGVILKSNTTCVLKNPTIYICTKDKSRDSWHGLTAFWTLVDDTYWYPAEEVGPKEHIVATTVLGLPNFLNEPSIEAHGTIFSEFDDKLFQTRLPVIRLDVQDTVAGKCAIDLDNPEDAPFSILALKAISVDRVVLLPVQSNSNTGKRLIDFLDEYNFKEVCKVCIVRDAGSLQYCLIEVLPAEDTDVRLLISARSEAQLSVVVQLMIETFPELLDVEKQQALDEAAEALRKEMQLYLSCNDTVQIQRARVTTDLLIP